MSTKKEPLISVHTKNNSSLTACDILCLQNCKLNTSSTPIATCFRKGMSPAWDCCTTLLLGHQPHQESHDVGNTQTTAHSLCWLRTVKVGLR